MAPLPTRPLSELVSLVAPYVASCPDSLIVEKLRLAAIDFCEGTRIWREVVTFAIDEENEAVVIPDHCALHEIESAYFNDETCPLTPVRFAKTHPNERDVVPGMTQTPRYITQQSHNTISLIPAAVGNVTASVILKPRAGPEYGVSGLTTEQDSQNVIPEFMYQQYAGVIADGATAHVMMIPKQPFTDLDMGSLKMAQFHKKISERQNLHIRGQQRAPVRTKASWF